jgi:MoaA/NifB/PqqE/SkfB family radical SAM enzyme
MIKAMSIFRSRGKIKEFGVYSNAAYSAEIQRVFSSQADYLPGMQMGISIDGDGPTHDRLRGDGAYKKTVKTIGWIANNFGKDIILDFKFTVNRINYGQMAKVYELAKCFKARFTPKVMEADASHYYHRHRMPGAAALAALTPEMIESVRGQVDRILNDGYPGVDRELVKAMMVLLSGKGKCIRACETPARSLFINSRRWVYPCIYLSPAGRLGARGELPKELDRVRQQHAADAAKGQCPGCYAYHGFLKKFNLQYLTSDARSRKEIAG